ncbi:enoyl-CoA hydratase-related protein [Cognatishimia sp.]|uniref:enoyl-CoA hydratase-related protein n=1 Tax=Cognatishimia sp. TaxID=2211648 RepID=UPI003514EC99
MGPETKKTIGQLGMQGTVDVETNGEVAVLRMSSGGRNPLTLALRSDLINALRQVSRLGGMRAVVLTAGGAYFSSGLELEELDDAQVSPTVADVARAIEEFELPVIAALQGPAFDAGFELALAAHYRIAVSTAKVGFEAINLGLTPCGGATQRLPRLIGAKNSLKVMMDGRRLSVKSLGLVFDAIVSGSFEQHYQAFAESLLRDNKPRRLTRDQDAGLQDPVAFQAAILDAREAARGDGQAKLDLIRCVEAAGLLPFEAGLALELDAYEGAIKSDVSQSYRHLLRAESRVRTHTASMDEGAWDVHKLAIIGATSTAIALAAVCLAASIGVIMIVPGEDMVRARAGVRKQIDRILQRNGTSALTVDQVIEGFELAPRIEDCVNSDMVLDLAGGTKDAQLDRFRQLGEFMPGHSVLATGTAQGGLADLGQQAQRSRQVVGLYAYAPVEVLPLVEVAQCATTSQVVVAAMARFVSRLEKYCVIASDAPGLIGNAVQSALFRAAEQLLHLGVEFEEIDDAMRAYGFNLGPFRLWDLGRGPRTGRLAQAMSEQGLTGRAGGAGFYTYEEGQTRRQPNKNAVRIVHALREGKDVPDVFLSASDIQFYCVAAMANEGARLLSEGVARCASDIDLVMTLGHGFPRHRGGPMKAADLYGLLTLRKKMRALAEVNPFWTPSSVFDDLIKNGQHFGDWT